MAQKKRTGWCEDLKIDCPHAEKGVLEIIQGCMEVSWQNQGGVKRLCHDHDPSIIGRFYILLPFASFTLSRLLLCWLVKSIGGSSHFVIFSWHIGSIRTPSESIIVKQFIWKTDVGPTSMKVFDQGRLRRNKASDKAAGSTDQVTQLWRPWSFSVQWHQHCSIWFVQISTQNDRPMPFCNGFHNVSSCFIWIGLFCG